MQLEADDPFADDVSKCWSFLVNGDPYTVVLYLASGMFDLILCLSKQLLDIYTVLFYINKNEFWKHWPHFERKQPSRTFSAM